MRPISKANFVRFAWCVLFLFLSAGYASAQESPAPQDTTNQKTEAQSSAPSPDQNQTTNEITAVPNRPTFSTTAEAVQRGVFEVEYGMELADGHQNINGLLKFGIFKNLELRFGNNPFERDSGIAGVGDSGVGFKYRMISEAAGLLPTISVLYTASIPTSTGTPGIGAVGHSVDMLVSKDFGKYHFDVNEGVHLLGRPGIGGYDRSYFTALSYSHPLTEKWGWTAEIAGFSWANAATPATMTLLFAATYNVSPRLVLDGGEYTAVYGNLPRATFFTGVTYSVADLYHLHRASQATKTKP